MQLVDIMEMPLYGRFDMLGRRVTRSLWPLPSRTTI